ncbi:MAG: energy transducer TonB [Spirochaetaceae bacterium]|jgi:protein TonB|nr:energy transducer TonB [Spirochaetaceae bacterium]
MMTENANRTRLAIFALAALAHILLIRFVAVKLETAEPAPEAPVQIMRILDLEEEIPLPPPPAPARAQPQNAVESIAETLIETDETPDQTIVEPGSLTGFQALGPGDDEYLPMSRVSVAPVFDERAILRNLVYPAIARRAGIEGLVYLELVIDRNGVIQRIRILREDPPGRGFGEAAVKAFDGISCRPAEANGRPVGVYYRYPIRFRLRD